MNESGKVGQLNFKQLEIFSKTVEVGSTTRSAVMLGLSQSAVSRNLAQLEKALGFDLFERIGGRLIPTPAALRLHKEVEKAVRAVQQAIDSAIGFDIEAVSGRLSIAALPSIGHTVLHQAIKSFLERYPSVHFSIQSPTSRLVMEIMAGGNADLGIVSMPISHPGVQTETFVELRPVCLMPKDHPLTKREEITIDDLHCHDLITLSRQHSSRHRLEELFGMAGLKPNIKVETSTAEMSCKLVQAGLGVVIVNEVTANSYKTNLEIRPFKHDMHYSYAFAFSANSPRSELAQIFVSYLKQMAAKEFDLLGI